MRCSSILTGFLRFAIEVTVMVGQEEQQQFERSPSTSDTWPPAGTIYKTFERPVQGRPGADITHYFGHYITGYPDAAEADSKSMESEPMMAAWCSVLARVPTITHTRGGKGRGSRKQHDTCDAVAQYQGG